MAVSEASAERRYQRVVAARKLFPSDFRTLPNDEWLRLVARFYQLYPALRRELLEEVELQMRSPDRPVLLEQASAFDARRAEREMIDAYTDAYKRDAYNLERERREVPAKRDDRATFFDYESTVGGGDYEKWNTGPLDLMNTTTTTETRTERPTKTDAASPRPIPVAPAPGRRKIRMED